MKRILNWLGWYRWWVANVIYPDGSESYSMHLTYQEAEDAAAKIMNQPHMWNGVDYGAVATIHPYWLRMKQP